MAQLLIRPALNDHQVIADLLAPPPMPTIRRARPPIAQLVSDAHIAVQRPTLAESANEAGIPFLVDPTTMLLQSDVDPTSSWAKLPFASARAMSVAEIDVEALVEQVVQFQVDQGATRIIAPYLYTSEPADPAFAMSIRLLAATAHYVRDNDVPLPVVAILCAQLRQFASAQALDAGVGRFVDAAEAHDAHTVGLCFSPVGAPNDSYSKLVGLFRVASRGDARANAGGGLATGRLWPCARRCWAGRLRNGHRPWRADEYRSPAGQPSLKRQVEADRRWPGDLPRSARPERSETHRGAPVGRQRAASDTDVRR